MGVIKDGYYYPSIEEIRIGYRCDINDSLGYETEYVHRVIGYKEEEGAYTNEIADTVHMMDDGYGQVRVNLLSKEDIESLGWVWDPTSEEVDTYTHVDGYSWLTSAKGEISIYRNKQGKILTVYSGPCPTINELIYLMRLLKI